MSFRYGFFNSKNGDRKYFASDFSMIFNGLIEDGVFGNVPDGFPVTSTGGMNIAVGKGLAWFSGTWNYIDALYPLTVASADVLYTRIDAVVIEVHNDNTVRTNYVKMVKGTPAAEPVPPSMEVEGYTLHPLAYVTVPAGAESISAENIRSVVGTSECPFVVGIQKTASVDQLFVQWQEEFDKWFQDLKDNLDENVAANLQNQITTHVTDKTMHIPTLGYSKEGTVHQLTGLLGVSGLVSCIFTATDNFVEGDTVTVDGETYAIQLSNGDTPGNNMFVSGAVISVIVDKEGKKVNFKSGGLVKTLITELIETTRDWTNPTYNDRPVMVTVVGGGGAGGSGSDNYYGTGGSGGNGANISFGTFELAKGEIVRVTVASASAGSGGGSSFGSYLSASGGSTGQSSTGGKGAYNGGAGGGSRYNGNGEYGGEGGKPVSSSQHGLDGSPGTNTVGEGLIFEGEGLAGVGGEDGETVGEGEGGLGGNGGSGGYGGNGGNGGRGGNGRYYDGSDGEIPEQHSNGGNGGSAGGGGYGAPGGNGGSGGRGGTINIYSSSTGNGGNAGNGGGGGYGAPGGTGGSGAEGLDILYIQDRYPDAYVSENFGHGGKGGHGGGGGYGPDGKGGYGGSGGQMYWSNSGGELRGGRGADGGDGGYGAGGGGGGTPCNAVYGEDRKGGTGGKGGPGLVIIQYWGFA